MIGYSLTKHADRELRKLPTEIQRRVIKKLERILASEHPFLLAEKLTGVPGKTFRIRIGDYRVIFDRLDSEIIVLAVGHRRDVYRNFGL